MKIYYVDTQEQLEEVCDHLSGSESIAVDTEFMREKSYFAQLCLIQVANNSIIACIDPLALSDLGPFLDILYDPKILKIMHAARQDLEIFYDLRGEIPSPLFDTQLAATLLAFGDQVSYANLVRELLGVDLEKSHTRTNWSQRPLEEGQLRYAEDDVRYLLEIAQRQRQELKKMGRLDWLQDDFADLIDIKIYRKVPAEAWRRIRGIRVLKGVQLAVLQELAAWREDRAKTMDKPRKWILRDELLVDLARRLPKNIDTLRNMRGLEPHIYKRYGAEILEVISSALQLPEEKWPTLGFRFTPSPEQEPLVDIMMAIVRQSGFRNGISPLTMASRRDLEKLLTDKVEQPLLHGWRGNLIGKELKAFLNGELSLRVKNGILEISSI